MIHVLRLPGSARSLAQFIAIGCVAVSQVATAQAKKQTPVTKSPPLANVREILPEGEVLRGRTGMSINVVLSGNRRYLPDSASLVAQMTNTMKEVGLKRLPDGAFPKLALEINGLHDNVGNNFTPIFKTVFVVRLSVLDTMTWRERGNAGVVGEFWTNSYFGLAGEFSNGIQKGASEVLTAFVESVKRVNPNVTPLGLETWERGPVQNGGTLEYSRVPDDFAPSSVPLLDPSWHTVEFLDRKSIKGALHMIKPESFEPLIVMVATNLASEQYIKVYPPPYDVINEDIAAIAAQLPRRGKWGPVVLLCQYSNPGAWWTNRVYWYKERPAAADPARLRGRMQNHPLLAIGGPAVSCPATLALADRGRLP